jgi:hypothetical protein
MTLIKNLGHHKEGAEPKPLIDRLDEAEGHVKGLLL